MIYRSSQRFLPEPVHTSHWTDTGSYSKEHILPHLCGDVWHIPWTLVSRPLFQTADTITVSHYLLHHTLQSLYISGISDQPETAFSLLQQECKVLSFPSPCCLWCIRKASRLNIHRRFLRRTFIWYLQNPSYRRHNKTIYSTYWNLRK